MVRGLADEVVGYNQTRGASRVMLQVGLSEFRTLPIDFTPALTLNCRRKYADDSSSVQPRKTSGRRLRTRSTLSLHWACPNGVSTAAVRQVSIKLGGVRVMCLCAQLSSLHLFDKVAGNVSKQG